MLSDVHCLKTILTKLFPPYLKLFRYDSYPLDHENFFENQGRQLILFASALASSNSTCESSSIELNNSADKLLIYKKGDIVVCRYWVIYF